MTAGKKRKTIYSLSFSFYWILNTYIIFLINTSMLECNNDTNVTRAYGLINYRKSREYPPCNNFYRHLARLMASKLARRQRWYVRIRTFIGARSCEAGFALVERGRGASSVVWLCSNRTPRRRTESTRRGSAGERCMYNVSVYVTGSHDRGHGLIFLSRPALRAGLPQPLG